MNQIIQVTDRNTGSYVHIRLPGCHIHRVIYSKMNDLKMKRPHHQVSCVTVGRRLGKLWN